jgi:lysozyme
MARLNKGAAIFATLVALVGGFEGLRTYAYRDPVGIPTICYGETRGVKMGMTKTVDECKDMLGDRLIEFSSGIDRCLTNEAAIPDKTYGAFVSFAYNVGVGAFCGSTLARKANSGDLVGACNQLTRWTKAGGIELPGLVKRRNEEKALCLSGLS